MLSGDGMHIAHRNKFPPATEKQSYRHIIMKQKTKKLLAVIYHHRLRMHIANRNKFPPTSQIVHCYNLLRGSGLTITYHTTC